MFESTIRQYKIKLIIAGVLVLIFGLATMFITKDILANLLFIALGISFFAYKFFYMKYLIKNEKLESFFAVCENEDAPMINLHNEKQKVDFRFLTLTDTGEAIIKDDNSVNIFLRAQRNKFKPGEVYSMIFIKPEDGDYNINNLLTYSVCPPSYVARNVSRTYREDGDEE